MERQLKERLIGAAVLVAIAVIMVPEMFSGPRSRALVSAESASASSDQVRTYHIELQSAHSSEPAPEPAFQEPAQRPQDEVSADAETGGSEYLSASSSSMSAASSSPSAVVSISRSSQSVASASRPSVKPQVQPAAVEAPEKPAAKPVIVNKPTDEQWVVQVGSFGTEEKARQIIATLKGQGHSAYIGKVKVGRKTLYRVRVGGMGSRTAAEAALQKINNTYPAASVMPANR